jgi:hypothetical protein
MTRKLVSKKELKLIYGIPYHPAHIARLETAGTSVFAAFQIGADSLEQIAALASEWSQPAPVEAGGPRGGAWCCADTTLSIFLLGQMPRPNSA